MRLLIFLLLFPLAVFSQSAITIGNTAADAGGTFCLSYTVISLKTAASGTGKINSISVLISGGVEFDNSYPIKVGTFYNTGENNYTLRDYVSVYVGNDPMITLTGLNINVVQGDFLGVYMPGVFIAGELGGSGSIAYSYGNKFVAGGTAFAIYASRTIYLTGTGVTVANGKKINGITFTKWNGTVITKFNNQ